MTTDEPLATAIQLIKAGRKADAQLALEPYIQANPHNILAWMWEVEIFPADCDKIKVLEICLEHNPGDPQAARALEILRVRSGIFPVVAPADSSPWTGSPVVQPEPPPAAPPARVPAVAGRPVAPPADRPAARPAAKPAALQTGRQRLIENKHPDWPTVQGVVDVSDIRVLSVNRIPTYSSEIEAMYVAKNRDYRVKFAFGKRSSISPFDAQILTSNYAPGTAVTVSYDPNRPRRAWVHEWDPRVVKRKLRNFKDRPEVSARISRQYRGRMLNGLWITLVGVGLTVIGNMFAEQLGLTYIVFTGAIVVGLFLFLTGLVGWLWNMD